MIRRLMAAALLVCAGASISSAAVQITIYNQDLALVKDTRPLDYKRGTFDLEFTDVAAAIDPTSVAFSTLDAPSSVTLLEQNFRYDLVSSEKVIEKYIDKTIRVITKQSKVHEGTLLASDGNALTLRLSDGSLAIVSRAEVADLSFPTLPEGLITRPTLVWKLDSDIDGAHPSEVRYLTGQVGWEAQYVGIVSAAETEVELSGWVSIDNRSGTTYDDATIKLIAGDVNRVSPLPRHKIEDMEMGLAMRAAAPFVEQEFFEYHLYTLQRPSTIRDNETKQLALFDPARVQATKVFTYDGTRNNAKVRVTMEFTNSVAAGLGIPLPKGIIRMMKADADGSLEFVGEDQIDHTPKDEKVRAFLGNAFDIVGERNQTGTEQISDKVREESFEIKLRNHKKEDVTVVVVERQWRGDWEIVRESHPHRKKDAGTAEWDIKVPKDGETILTYTARRRW